ncbi:hypothetical protein LBW62_24195 [Ralstonia solanacearum]|uniref:hypothetical protein n=1 Tax=Ralstonia solanacearum TaxID=305 RepID=UPI0005C6E449|nr:hypothetical protein [Ralstonia solanacearum]MDB0544340.1 hypothetical protein [Ralstonia solanacearum]MDB0554173.1 hypothetical protein [Ralstonia solanacearum]MDB0559266.1 hypothetical protein [Ralstonia solanacearum]
MHRWLAAAVAGIVAAAACPARTDESPDRTALAESKVLLCHPGPGLTAFPSKQTNDAAQPCDDGDMPLSSGLLCTASDKRGCQAVNNNVFFAWFDEGSTAGEREQVLVRCPAVATVLKHPLYQQQGREMQTTPENPPANGIAFS